VEHEIAAAIRRRLTLRLLIVVATLEEKDPTRPADGVGKRRVLVGGLLRLEAHIENDGRGAPLLQLVDELTMQGTRPTPWITRELEVLGRASVESDVLRRLDRSANSEQPCKPHLLLEIDSGGGERKQHARRADYKADNQRFEAGQLAHVALHHQG
jgi:hypothetical protein